MMSNRLRLFRTLLKKHNLDAVIISSSSNIIYASGYSGFSHVERDGYILITESAAFLITSPLYAEEVVSRVSHLEIRTITGKTPLTNIFSDICSAHTLKRVGFEDTNITFSEWQLLQKSFPTLVPLRTEKLRIQKSPEEIRAVTKAAKIADTALQHTLPMITPGMTEMELVHMLEKHIRAKTPAIAFPTIVAFGKNAAIPHHKSDTTRLKKNDLILIDFGATWNDYRSDMSRTLFVGSTTNTINAAYHTVLQSQQEAVNYIQTQLRNNDMIRAAAVDTAAREYLLNAGYPTIPHSLGHGIGLEVHEAPRLGPNSLDTLEEGMVFSIEPGIYIPEKFGIRIEDLYTIQNEKLKRLTKFPSHLIII